jgi:N-acetylmuramoyl-L-alanine amidase
MKRISFLMILLMVILSASISSQNQLSGLVVIIDPGHGGLDTGAIVRLNKVPIIESVYSYDVALRLERMLLNKGAIVFKTTKNNNIINNKDTIKLYPKTFFSLDGSIVERGILGLDKRTSFANLKAKKYPSKKIVFISIHFDISRLDYLGVRIIKGENDTIGNFIRNEFEQNYLLSNSLVPVLENGDKTHGIRHLYVLGGYNKINNKILLELSNLKNEKDLSRVLNANMRENYAFIIYFALEKYMNEFSLNK